MGKNNPMQEIKSRRRRESNRDHYSTRVYEIDGEEYEITKMLDMRPYYYSACRYTRKEWWLVRVDGKQYWGEGLSWKQAEAKFLEALNGQLS